MQPYRAFLLGVLALGASGCSARSSDRDVIFMVSTIHALVEGLFDGEVTIQELKRHGDLGLGAVDGVDGELVLVDGIAYQIKADGTVVALDGSVKTPYALVTPLDFDRVLPIEDEADFDQLRQRLDTELGHPALPYAFRIDGTFSYVRTRSVPKQAKPYPRLIEIIKKEPEFEFRDIDGVLVGVRMPEHLDSLAVPGYHFHFLTADRRGGGHLLAFRARRLRVVADLSPAVHAVFPQNETFSRIDLSHRNREELDQIMGRTGQR